MSIKRKSQIYLVENAIKFSFVADKAGINKDWLNKSLNGKRRLTANEFLNICTALGLDILISQIVNTSAA